MFHSHLSSDFTEIRLLHVYGLQYGCQLFENLKTLDIEGFRDLPVCFGPLAAAKNKVIALFFAVKRNEDALE